MRPRGADRHRTGFAPDEGPPPPQDRHLYRQGVLSAEAQRRRIGIEAARIILGHRSAAIARVYPEKDKQQAVEGMAKVE